MPEQRLDRRTQEERSAATREAVLSATIDCLVECGYAATSTSVIQRRAAISRGALTHQFPSKQHLLVAAVDHLSEVREREILATVSSLPSGSDHVREGLRLLWQSFTSDLFLAALELWTAARTDDALHETLYAAERRLGHRHRSMLAGVFGPALASQPSFDHAVELVIRQMRGTALTDVLRRSHADEEDVIDECIALLHASLGLDTTSTG